MRQGRLFSDFVFVFTYQNKKTMKLSIHAAGGDVVDGGRCRQGADVVGANTCCRVPEWPGARPTKHISIEFEIRWKFKTL